MVRLTTYCLLAVLVAPALNLPTPCYTEETRLLHSIGLGHLAHKFEASEVKIQHMAILVSGVTDILQQLEDEASGRGGEEDPGEEEAEEGRAEVGGGEEEVQAGGGEVEEVTEGSALEVQGLEEFEAAEEEEVQRELQEEVQEEVRGVACRTPGTRRRPRLQSQATPAGGSMLDLEHMSGTVSRSHLFLRSSSHISYPT